MEHIKWATNIKTGTVDDDESRLLVINWSSLPKQIETGIETQSNTRGGGMNAF